MAHQPLDFMAHRIDSDGFGHITVHACSQITVFVPLEGVGAEHTEH